MAACTFCTAHLLLRRAVSSAIHQTDIMKSSQQLLSAIRLRTPYLLLGLYALTLASSLYSSTSLQRKHCDQFAFHLKGKVKNKTERSFEVLHKMHTKCTQNVCNLVLSLALLSLVLLEEIEVAAGLRHKKAVRSVVVHQP